jgi:UDP-3-O-acyl-N-acetylglucosamine deacetylase
MNFNIAASRALHPWRSSARAWQRVRLGGHHLWPRALPCIKRLRSSSSPASSHQTEWHARAAYDHHSLSMEQCTVRQDTTFVGIGLHSGEPCEMTLRPAPADHGITFERRGMPPVLATWASVLDTTLCTVLAGAPPTPLGRRGQRVGYMLTRLGASMPGSLLSGTTISTVEHIMAALSGAGINNVAVDLSSSEVPIMDGSASEFTAAFTLPAAVCPIPNSRACRVHVQREVVVATEDGRRVSLSPWDASCESERVLHGDLLIHVEIDYGSKLCTGEGIQKFTMERREFAVRAAAARTFCFYDDVLFMHRCGLAKGAYCIITASAIWRRLLNSSSVTRAYPSCSRVHKYMDLYQYS